MRAAHFALLYGLCACAPQVDDACLMFQTGWGTSLERGGWEAKPGPGNREGPYLRHRAAAAGGYCEVHNTETDTVPPLAHFNGDKREFIGAEDFCFQNMDEAAKQDFKGRLAWFVGLYPKIAEKCNYAKGVAGAAGG